jgi:hypothetical protein
VHIFQEEPTVRKALPVATNLRVVSQRHRACDEGRTGSTGSITGSIFAVSTSSDLTPSPPPLSPKGGEGRG